MHINDDNTIIYKSLSLFLLQILCRETYSVVLHPLEDGSAGQDSTNDDTQTRLCKDNIGCASGSISGISNCNSNICLLQSRGIVDSISCHSTNMLPLLKPLHNFILVLCFNAIRIRPQAKYTMLIYPVKANA